jgi:hypothetical protein
MKTNITLTTITLALLLLTPAAFASTAAQLATQINNNYFSAVASGNTVTVTGGEIGATSGLSLNIDANVTVVWQADLTTNTVSLNMVTLDGGGTFNMESGSIGSYSGRAINNLGAKVNISGGTVSASGTGGATGTAIYNSNSGTVTISGGTISATQVSTRAVDNSGTVTISGGTVRALSASLCYAIYNSAGATVILGGTVTSSTAGYDKYVSGGMIITWNEAAGNTTYTAFTNNDIAKLPASGTTAQWLNKDGKAGISYAYGVNAGFIEVPGVTVNKATLSVTFPRTDAITYNPATTLSQVPLIGSNIRGTFSWQNPSTVPTVINSGYSVVFTPTDAENYPTLSELVTLIVRKANPAYATPTLAANYGETLADVALPTGWAWESALTTPVGNVGTRVHKAKFTPADTDNYNILAGIDVSVSVYSAYYMITKSGSLYTAKGGTTSNSIQTVIDGIKAGAAGDDCAIQFGDGVETLDIGNSQINFDGTGTPTWGKITLLGKITLSNTIRLSNGASVESKADISSTSVGYTVVSNSSTGTVTISGGTVSTTGDGDAISNLSTGAVIISGGTVSSTGDGYAIGNSSTGSVTISGGTVLAGSDDFSHAIVNESTGAVTISGGLVFAQKRDVILGTYNASSGNPVIIGWNKPSSGTPAYNAMSSTALTVSPSLATATWQNKDGKAGIEYANGENTGFIEIDGVSVTGTSPIRLPQIAGGNIRAYASGGSIVLQNLPTNAKVEVFGLNGKLVYSSRVNPSIGGIGVQTISVQTKGMYIVKIGNTHNVFRVAVR